MNFYRYFYNIRDPFLKITNIQSDNVQEYLKLIKDNSLAVRTYNTEYINNRLLSEKIMREKFIEKGGKPVLEHPHYFVLENCDYWFYQEKNNVASLAINSNMFPKDIVSFTYGDSVPTFIPQYNDGKEYRNKVYTTKEIKNIINKYSLPQLWNANCKYGFENYIEVQVWSDDVIKDYSFKDCNNIYKTLDLYYEAFLNANENIKSIIYTFPQQIKIEEAIKIYKDDYYFKKINNLYNIFKDIYSNDKMHGIEHAFRTAVYMVLIGKIANVQEEFLEKMILVGFAHDIGRKYSNGEEHGKISAEMLQKIVKKNEDISIIKNALIAHSLSNYQLYIDININNEEELNLIKWLQDADTLDYIRFGIKGYNPKLLRTEEAKKLFEMAMKINLYMYVYPKDDFKILNKE